MKNWSEERLVSTGIHQLQRGQVFVFGLISVEELRTETPMDGSLVNT